MASNASHSSNSTSASLLPVDIGDLNPNHQLTGATHPTPSRQRRSSSSLSARSNPHTPSASASVAGSSITNMSTRSSRRERGWQSRRSLTSLSRPSSSYGRKPEIPEPAVLHQRIWYLHPSTCISGHPSRSSRLLHPATSPVTLAIHHTCRKPRTPPPQPHTPEHPSRHPCNLFPHPRNPPKPKHQHPAFLRHSSLPLGNGNRQSRKREPPPARAGARTRTPSP